MKKIPTAAKAYKRTPVFDEKNVPVALLQDHSTKPEVWGKIVVLEGRLRYIISGDPEEYLLTPELFGVVEPEVKHHVSPVEHVKFYVEFYKISTNKTEVSG